MGVQQCFALNVGAIVASSNVESCPKWQRMVPERDRARAVSSKVAEETGIAGKGRVFESRNEGIAIGAGEGCLHSR